MNQEQIMELAWTGAKLAFRAVMAARTRQDAESIITQLRSWGDTRRADVGSVEERARERLRQQREAGDVLHPGGPLDEGD